MNVSQNGDTVRGEWTQADEYGSFVAKEVNWHITGKSTCFLRGKGNRKTRKCPDFGFTLGLGLGGATIGGTWRGGKWTGERISKPATGKNLKIKFIPRKPKRRVITIGK